MLMAKLKKGSGRARYFEFLIDSGADFTLLPKSDTLLLGFDYEDLLGEEIRVEVANQNYIHTKKLELTIAIEESELRIPVLIANKEVERLLGRKGIFENFDITFQEIEKQVIFKKNSQKKTLK